jgi:hypothetical protein
LSVLLGEPVAERWRSAKDEVVVMNPEDAIPLLEAIIAREREDGCAMASESLIAPALRRWRSYARRFKHHKNKSLEHRAYDLEKGLLESYPDYSYDPGCIRHLAQSFAEALFRGSADGLLTPSHTKRG